MRVLSLRIAISLWVVLAAFALVSCSGGTAAKTEVIRFTPATPGGEAREGYCWIGSLIEGRPDAFRCMVGNQIFDPCFAVGKKSEDVAVRKVWQ